MGRTKRTRFECFDHLDGALCENLPWYKKYHDSKFVNILHTLLFVVFLFGIVGSISYTAYITDTKPAQAAAKTWTGLGDDVSCGTGNSFNWSCGANWSDGTVPVTGDAITFNNTSAKDAVLDAGFSADSILSLTIANTYTGTITLEKDLHTTGVFTQSGGTFDAGSYALDIDSNFTLSGTANFTAPSSTMNLGAGLNIAATTTFNHNDGIITFDGASQTLLCNNAGFNLVNLWNTATANLSDCQMNLGNNPTTLSIVLNNSTLVGTGELRMQGQLLFNTGSPSITGFTDFDFNSSLTINNGTFNAPSGTMNLAGHFNFNGGTFNHNDGTIVLDGPTQNFNCNGADFYLVDLSLSVVQARTFNDCDIPLGNNPTIGSVTSFQNNTIVSGTGTLTASPSRNMTVGSGATFSGFTGLDRSSGGTLTVNTDSDFSSYTTFIAPILRLDSGTLNLPDNADLDNVTINGGVFNAPAGNMNMSGSFNFNGGTFNHNDGTIVLDGTTQVFNCNGADFYLVDLSLSVVQARTFNDCDIPLGNNPTIGSVTSFQNNTIVSGTGTLTASPSRNMTVGSGATFSGFTGLDRSSGGTLVLDTDTDFSGYTTFIINSLSLQSGILNLPDKADINTALDINGGTLNAPNGKVFIGGKLSLNGGAFNHNNGALIFDDNSTQVIPCNISYNLVDFAGDGMKMIGSSCVIPIGNNPSLDNAGDIVLEGEIIGSGTLDRQGGALRLQGNNAKLTGFSNYSAENIFVTNGILGHWIFDDETAKDVSGNNNHGILGGGYNFDDNAISQEGRSIIFNGIDGYMATEKSSNLRPQFPFTVSLWHKADNATDKVLMSSNTENGPGWVYDGFRLQVSSSGIIGAGYGTGLGGQDPGSRFSASTNPILEANTWHHIAAVYNGPQDIDIYLDGEQQAIATTSGGASIIGYYQDDSQLFLGRVWDATPEPDNFTYYNAQLDDVRIYSVALSEADIQALASENPNTALTSFALIAPLNISGNLTLQDAQLVSGGNAIDLSGNWININGDFNHGQGVVNLTGGNQAISGNNTFFNLFKESGGILTFEAESTQTVQGELRLQGQQGSLLQLRSSEDGAQWNIDPQGTRSIEYVDVKDSNNINSATIIAAHSLDSGNNINWQFLNTPVDPDEPEESEEPTDPEEPDSPTDPTTPPKEEKPDTDGDKDEDDNGEGETPIKPGEPTDGSDSKDEQTIIKEIFSAQIFKDPIFYAFLFILLLTLICWAIKRSHDDLYHKNRN